MTRWDVTLTVEASRTSFTEFAERVGTPLLQALSAAYGPNVGPDATAEALAYAWEHWDRVRVMRNPGGYLYRVGQSKARRGIFRRPPHIDPPRYKADMPWIEPSLYEAFDGLTDKQRAAVVLVHGYQWTVSEVARMWGVSFSTVQRHIDRALSKLREELGVDHDE